ncbi:MAG: peptide-methionine (S)-S-oxide reductase MsrA [Pseudomonadota bacterium]
MIATFSNLKPMALAAAIVVGIALQCTGAHAQDTRTIVVAGGCFWCVESDFERVDGVVEAVSGFAGGNVDNPTYRQVVSGGTGHIEAVKITYDPSKVTYSGLLDLFFRSIDPTDAGGQFCDRGASYRSAVFVTGDRQAAAANKAIAKAQRALGQEVVTEVIEADRFWPAEEYHQDYAKKSEIVLTRRGPKTKAEAYKFYRKACGRDARVKELWGSDAPFIGGHS